MQASRALQASAIAAFSSGVARMAASRLATAVGFHPGLTATPDGFWNVVFPRYAQALADLGVAELLQERYG